MHPFWGGAGAGLAAGIGLAVLWFRRRREQRLLKPLREMVRVARALAGGDLYPRFPKEGRPELQELAEALNATAATLEAKLTELGRLERVRIDFVANVSHELRTPLTSIKGFVETLRDGALKDPETAGRFLEIIRKHTDRIIAIVDDLLTLSHLEGSGPSLNLAEMDLAELAEEVAEGFRRRCEEKTLSLRLELKRPARLRGDRDRLAQVFTNLLDNAVKYTPEGGSVSLSLAPEGEGWRIQVADTGIGIPVEHLPRIFERFYRVDKARSREMGGTGLGLSIVKHIVQAHGGSIDASNPPGRGTLFTVRLPATRS